MVIELDFVAINAIVGFLLPLLISFLKRNQWPSQVKKYFAFGAAIVSAVAVTGAQYGWTSFNFGDLLAAAAVIYPLAQTTYVGFWEDMAVEVRLAEVGSR